MKTKEEILKEVMGKFSGVLTYSSAGRIFIEDAISEAYKSGQEERIIEEILFLIDLDKLDAIGKAEDIMNNIYKRLRFLKELKGGIKA